ncbi:DNA adenine methylase [Halomicrobium sp. IBSBa]|uniref:DNA adenine methylase n=2 Tax=unclassified Halomicrobium TaxID=2610901 RepID=UPI001ABF3A4F|nr:DNA adenine methylase [Halomicrobium sp. IBSBa]MBO4248385.1 DNA adenine methylase [Halomicrobium sp. IBSBa]
MVDAVFPFPGGKSRLASWILDQVPQHECFVEVFGGAAGVLVNKNPDTSTVEVYNDLDEDLVHFFEVLRQQPDELVQWLSSVPYSRAIHSEWAEAYYQGYRPKEDVKRAGQFFYLRYAQWGGAYDGQNGFATSKVSNRALSFANKIDRLREFADRFEDVVVENLHWQALVEKYDSDETVFYFDPPYVGTEDYYPTSEIVHEELVGMLSDLDGYGICSYQELPEGSSDLRVLARDSKNYINSGTSGSANETRERLLLNFDPVDQ